MLEKNYDIKIMGVLEGACRKAVAVTKNNRIGVIGTSGTVRSGKYEEIITAMSPGTKVFSNACPLFVPLVENGYAESEAARLIARDYLTPLKNEKVDTLILGCTHYPLLRKVISDIMGDEVALLSPGALAAEDARAYLEGNGLLSEKECGKSEFFVSDSVENFSALGGTFLGKPIDSKVHLVEVAE